MKLSDAVELVNTSIEQRIPVMMWGPPGIGKSSIVHQIAKSANMIMVDVRLAQLEPTDIRGVPMPNRETNRAHWYLPSFWPQRAESNTTRKVEVANDKTGKTTTKTVEVEAGCGVDGPGIVFLDEIEKAPISVKNASLQLVLDRRIGDYKLPDDWAIVCAGNREEDGAFSAPLGSALENRMIHLAIEPDVDSWASWARENGVHEDIIGYLYFRNEHLYKRTEDHAFPTPRSWAMGSDLIKAAKNDKQKKQLLSAAIGAAVAQEYKVWSTVYKNVNPEEVLNGTMPDFEGKDQGYKYAVALAVSFHLRKRKKSITGIEDNVANFLGLITPELRVIFFKQQTLGTMEKMAKHPAFKTRVKEIMKIAI